LHQVAIDFEAQAKQKDLPIRVIIAPDTPSVLSTEHHIREILQNYMNNALKYTQKGHVTLKAEPTRTGGVLFSISDTGVGISATDQQHLFTKFYRAEDYRTRETGGTGLGLYLCLELAQRLNAKVWCESVINTGSTFFLEVPPFSRLERDHGKVMEAQVSSLVDQL
jgi:two-component system, OmpR family, phosphate regulon sensor histidine kinase PhoR